MARLASRRKQTVTISPMPASRFSRQPRLQQYRQQKLEQERSTDCCDVGGRNKL